MPDPIEIGRGGCAEAIRAKLLARIEAAEHACAMAPLGDGHGNPAKRNGAAVARDLADGRTGIKTAKNTYSWAL